MRRLLKGLSIAALVLCCVGEPAIFFAAEPPIPSQKMPVGLKNPPLPVKKPDVAAKVSKPDSLQIISPNSSESSSQSLTISSKNLISIDYKDANLSDVLKAISYSYNLNIVVAKNISGKVSAKLKDLTIEDALNAILSVNNYAFMRQGNIVYVMPASEMKLSVESIPLSFLSPKEAKGFLGSATSGGRGDIQANESTNSLIVKGTAAELENIKQIIKTVDVPPIQVLIEAKIVDISQQDIEKIGSQVNFQYNPTSGNLAFLGGESGSLQSGSLTTSATASTNSGASNTLGSSDGGLFGYVGKFNNFNGINPSIQLEALVTQHKANVLAAPSIATLNGKEASITIGQKVAYIGTTSTTGSTATNSTAFADIGTKLRVTPTVSLDGWITMKVHPEVSSLLGVTSAGPNISTREADAEVRVKDNQTIIIGGLINRSDLVDNNGVPFLKDIPFLGNLFKRHGDQLDKGTLTVFITPHIIPMPRVSPVIQGVPSQNTTTAMAGDDLNLVSGLLEYADSLEHDKSKDYAKNLYLSREQIKSYRMILDQFPQSGRGDYCLYRIALIYAKEFARCDEAKEALNEMKKSYPQSSYVNITDSLVNACIAVGDQGMRK
ncbi:MAG: secretin and TonB N-terminal domain-containing protein [Candidatus Omnitrophica bacterium]|nr:secretin and TonB N-terminal domain-containing protein [Candidatus Omnitrophota bacterium]